MRLLEIRAACRKNIDACAQGGNTQEFLVEFAGPGSLGGDDGQIVEVLRCHWFQIAIGGGEEPMPRNLSPFSGLVIGRTLPTGFILAPLRGWYGNY
jgi:hypothetical protein